MALLSAYNPHELKADTVLKVATGRDEPLARLLHIIRGNLTANTKQHVIVSAPRGYGKSFLLRYVQVKIEEIAKNEGLPVAMALLPEELPHVKEPDTLLAEIRRTFLNEPADTVRVRWVEDDGEAWYQRVRELDTAITERLGSNGLLIAAVENFDLLLRKTFAKDVHGGSLREFLTRKGNRVMLLTASARGAFDREYDRPLFKAFEEVALEPWTVDDCIAFFRAQRAAAGKQPLTNAQEAKAKAVATFIGGTPRLATLIGDALLEDDPLRAADLLDKLVDELTPYYKERIEVLPARSQALLDGLLRGGEKCSATELARRVGAPNQPAIAAPLDELKKDLVVIGEKAPDSAEVLLRVTDRVFAHYYRKRILSHGQEVCPLEALVELLAVFYSPDEKRREAEKLKDRGLAREAALMERLWEADQTRDAVALGPKLEPERDARLEQRMDRWDRAINEGHIEEALHILDEVLADSSTRNNPDFAEVLAKRAWTLNKLDRHKEALATAHEAAAFAERVGAVGTQTNALRNAAFSLVNLKRHDEAIATAREAAALAKRIDVVDEQAIALGLAALSLIELDRYDEAAALARDAAPLAERAGNVTQQSAAHYLAAFSLGQLERHDEAVLHARDAAALAQRTGDLQRQASALHRVAFSLGQLEHHDEAVTAARDAANLAKRAGNLKLQASALRRAAYNLGRLRRHEEAIAATGEAAALAEQVGDLKGQVSALRRTAYNLGELERHEEAVTIAREAAGLAGKVGDLEGQASALRQAADSLGDLGRHQEAVAAAREAAAFAERAGDVDEQTIALYLAAYSLSHLERQEEAVTSAREAVALAERSGNIDMQRSATGLLLAFRSIELESALTYYQLLVDTNSSGDAEAASVWFDDITHIVTKKNAWPRLTAILANLPRTAERIIRESVGLGEAGDVIATALATNQRDTALSQASHFVATLAQAIETATDPAQVRLWAAVLNASAERIATRVEDAHFLSQFGDILAAHAALPERAKGLIAAAAAYHASGRDPIALARLEPDLATTLEAVFGPATQLPKKQRKTSGRRKR
jgi:hypothetical protein